MWWNKAPRKDGGEGGGREGKGERHTERHAGMVEIEKGRETYRETHTHIQGQEETGESHSSLEGMPN